MTNALPLPLPLLLDVGACTVADADDDDDMAAAAGAAELPKAEKPMNPVEVLHRVIYPGETQSVVY